MQVIIRRSKQYYVSYGSRSLVSKDNKAQFLGNKAKGQISKHAIRKQSMPNFLKNEHLPPYTHTYIRTKIWSALFSCSACFSLLPYYRQVITLWSHCLLNIFLSFPFLWGICLNFTIQTTCHVSEQTVSGNSSLLNYVNRIRQPRLVNAIQIMFNKQSQFELAMGFT